MKKNTSLFFALLLLVSCSKKKDNGSGLFESEVQPLSYAEGFKISSIGNAQLVEVIYPYQGSASGHKYLLVRKGELAPEGITDAQIIYVPIQKIICTSTTHIPMLDYLGETNSLIGFPTLDYISSKAMRKRIARHEVQELGVDKGMDLEMLASLRPDLVMGYSIGGNYGQFKKIEDLNIPVVINAEYLEKNPLGRAEWIKFVAAFYNKEQLADSIFKVIEKEYNATLRLIQPEIEKPTVMSGILYSDAWFLPGGQNYAAHLYQDAGMDYLWKSDSSHGFLQLSFESVYARAHQADYWIGVASFESLEEMKNAEYRYAQFQPFQNKTIYTYNQRKGAKGGNEFLELGYLRPDIILKDLVKITHPELLPEYELYFHRKLE